MKVFKNVFIKYILKINLLFVLAVLTIPCLAESKESMNHYIYLKNNDNNDKNDDYQYGFKLKQDNAVSNTSNQITVNEVDNLLNDIELINSSIDPIFYEAHGFIAHPTLLALIDIGINNNPTVLSKQADYAASLNNINSMQSQFLPNLSISSERGATINKKNTHTQNLMIRLQQTLWDGNRSNNNLSISRLKALYSENIINETQQLLAMNIIDAWQGLLINHGRIISSEKNLERLNKLNDMIKRRIKQQVSPIIDNQLINTRLLQARSEHLTYKTNYHNAYQRLEKLIANADVLKKLITINVLNSFLNNSNTNTNTNSNNIMKESIYNQLLDNIDQHPSLQKYDIELNIAQYEIKNKQAELLPLVYARIERQFTKNTSHNNTVENSAYIGLQWSTGSGLSLLSQVESEKLRLDSIFNNKESYKRDIQEKLSNEWNEYLSTSQKVNDYHSIQMNQVELMNSNIRLFVAGRRSWIELLNAVRELSQAEHNLNDLQAQLQTMPIRLYILSGEPLWKN